MIRIFIYLLLFGIGLFLLSMWTRTKEQTGLPPAHPRRFRKDRKGKIDPHELWNQVYETATVEEARILQARLQEQEIRCIIYEQGKKDIHGNALKGFGIAVPKPLTNFAQELISRLPA